MRGGVRDCDCGCVFDCGCVDVSVCVLFVFGCDLGCARVRDGVEGNDCDCDCDCDCDGGCDRVCECERKCNCD